ncbi:hypothetical protein A0H81_11912 [Grifola frondosa]|uniref:Uncharacterized protein n=1 Tax=Grifola frondosa TaxID=5627 RepID=A0A1C7LWG1_GRIFR|nr:hypothetical protein A0H81_11912 [Grifola frondosa]
MDRSVTYINVTVTLLSKFEFHRLAEFGFLSFKPSSSRCNAGSLSTLLSNCIRNSISSRLRVVLLTFLLPKAARPRLHWRLLDIRSRHQHSLTTLN